MFVKFCEALRAIHAERGSVIAGKLTTFKISRRFEQFLEIARVDVLHPPKAATVH